MARIEKDGEVLKIVLSERNLIALLTKLHTEGSHRELQSFEVPMDFDYARLIVEDDETHYSHPSRDGYGPGIMHPLTEVASRAVKEALANGF